ncbi:MAG: (Fe-S)-binding protein, partial [Clostridia bacterium]|nr:(Fe-S)-binding protein [Clostridia bacterium]
NVFECCTCGACVHDCVTGWDPVMFTKEARLQAALEGKLPEYIMTLVANCLETGNAYGKTSLCDTLKEKISAYAKKTDTLLFLGVDARYAACKEALKAIKVLEKAGVEFSLVENEAASGAQLDFLIGAANETKAQAEACAKLLNEYKTVVVYDPNDAKMIKQIYKELGVEVGAFVVTFTTYVAELLKNGKLKANKSDNTVVFQDPYQLSRDLGETEPAREIIKAYANLEEMLLNRDQTVWAGNILMAQYMPEIIKKVSARRLLNVKSIGQSKIVTACVSEYVALKSVATDVEVLSIEDLILA